MNKYTSKFLLFLFLFPAVLLSQNKLLIPMESNGQTNHLKAYGIAYRHLLAGKELDWLLNYRGGSFLFNFSSSLEEECKNKNVSYELLDGTRSAQIYAEAQDESKNTDVIRLEKVARLAVYIPPFSLPWDDAVQLAMDYAEIPYDKLWDEEVLSGKLKGYDWIHLHHEDFSGQYGKFFATYGMAAWYQNQMKVNEETAKKFGYKKVSGLKLAVVKKLKEYIANGGFLFTMCSATDTYDIALAVQYTDICDAMYDHDGFDTDANNRLDFSECIAFQDFQIELNPYVYKYSNIDITTDLLSYGSYNDYFKLVDFSAKFDPVPTMLIQCHTSLVKGFLGQTSGFHKQYVKPNVVILGMNEGTDFVKYIHGNYGKGTFTLLGGHDPEDYQHLVGAPATELNNYPNSPGYRLILNNVLFPAAKKKKLKT
ncbi:MAG: asparagine synthetase B [Ignavibacteriae bacterium]|nr:asparagine synthetase B [Ignavibacteriota bacterium]